MSFLSSKIVSEWIPSKRDKRTRVFNPRKAYIMERIPWKRA